MEPPADSARHGRDPAAVREPVDTPPATAPAGAGAAAVWTLAATALWVLLAAWRPTTTWHLGPVFVAAAAPWVVGQDLHGGNRRAATRLGVAAGAGFLVAAAATWVLAAAGLLVGPTLPGFSRPWLESLVLAAFGAAVAVVLGFLRVRRRHGGAAGPPGDESVR